MYGTQVSLRVISPREAQSARLHLDPSIVEASTIGNVSLMGGSERGDGLSVTTRAQPGTFFGADNARPYVRSYAQRQDYFSRIVPHSHRLSIRQPSMCRVVWVHLEHGSGIARRETAKCRSNTLVRSRCDQCERVARHERTVGGELSSVALAQCLGLQLYSAAGCLRPHGGE